MFSKFSELILYLNQTWLGLGGNFLKINVHLSSPTVTSSIRWQQQLQIVFLSFVPCTAVVEGDLITKIPPAKSRYRTVS